MLVTVHHLYYKITDDSYSYFTDGIGNIANPVQTAQKVPE